MAWGWNTQTHTADKVVSLSRDKSKHVQLSDPTLASCINFVFLLPAFAIVSTCITTSLRPPLVRPSVSLQYVWVYLFSLLWLLLGSSCFTPTAPSVFWVPFYVLQPARLPPWWPLLEAHLKGKNTLKPNSASLWLDLSSLCTRPTWNLLYGSSEGLADALIHCAVECSHCTGSHSELLLDTWLSHYRRTHKISEVVPPDPLRISSINKAMKYLTTHALVTLSFGPLSTQSGSNIWCFLSHLIHFYIYMKTSYEAMRVQKCRIKK